MMNKVALFCAACAIALHGLAADKYYLITSESSKGQNGGFYNPSYWSSNGGDTGTIKQEFDPDAEYVVYKKNGSKIYIKAAPDGKTYDFGGGSLVLGEGTSSGALYNYAYNVSEESANLKVLTFGSDGLIIRCGGILLSGANDKTYVIESPMTVDTEDGAYAFLHFYYNNVTFVHRGPLSITEGSVFVVGDNTLAHSQHSKKGTFKLTQANSCSGVSGTLEIISLTNKLANAFLYEYDTTFSVASTDLPGTLKIGANCRLNLLSGVLNVGTLVLGDNTWLTIPYDSVSGKMGMVNVTDALTAGREINVVLPAELPSGVKKVAILTAPASSELSIRNFKLAPNTNYCWLMLETEDDRQILYVTFPDVTQNIKSAYLGETESWSDGSTSVAEGKDYSLVSKINGVSGDHRLYMPKQSLTYEFSGNSLNIHSSTMLQWTSDTIQQLTCPYLRVFDGGVLHGDKMARLRMKGGILDLVSGTVSIGSSNERTLIIDSEIIGYGEALLTGLANGSSSSPQGYYAFNALNTNFYGTIKMRQRHWKSNEGKVYIDFDTSCRLTITNALSLGGNLLKLNPKALWLTRYASLLVEESTTLAAESNRGIYIEDIGRIRVGNKKGKPYTFRIETPLAINGTFYKEGLGTLELAGGMAFGEDGLAETPTEGSNGFVVTGGVVRVCSAGAIDGCSMELHDGTSLELAVDFENEELMAQGIRNVKTDTPFVLGEGVEKLPVSLKFAEGATAPSTKFTVPLLTVSSGAAASVRAMLPAVKFPFKSYQATLKEITDSETGNVTFAYELQYQALKVIVR
ncbi:MAG: hypothetical protein IKJ37_11325 [Kiritimatiellae bacterium]|nr:hypothetical protein [Kiritimatiellia bacterium]